MLRDAAAPGQLNTHNSHIPASALLCALTRPHPFFKWTQTLPTELDAGLKRHTFWIQPTPGAQLVLQRLTLVGAVGRRQGGDSGSVISGTVCECCGDKSTWKDQYAGASHTRQHASTLAHPPHANVQVNMPLGPYESFPGSVLISLFWMAALDRWDLGGGKGIGEVSGWGWRAGWFLVWGIFRLDLGHANRMQAERPGPEAGGPELHAGGSRGGVPVARAGLVGQG